MFTSMNRVVLCTIALFVARSTQAAFALNDLYNTGVDASHSVRADGATPDLHYALVAVPGGTPITVVRRAIGGFPIPPYLGDNNLSAWIGPNNDHQLDSPPGDYDFRTTFVLLPSEVATASISGRWSSDNDGVFIKLNGVAVSGPTDFAQFTDWAAFNITSNFLPGPNTLDFVVHNGGSGPGNNDPNAFGNNPTGVRVEMFGAVPEASSMLVFGLTSIMALGAVVIGRRHGWSFKI
jgi:hypothetical protein